MKSKVVWVSLGGEGEGETGSSLLGRQVRGAENRQRSAVIEEY